MKNKKQNGSTWCALLLTAAVMVPECVEALEAPFPTRDKPFAVKDSGVEVPPKYGGLVKWMDNDRVIFSALRKDVPKNINPEGLRIVIWDTVKGTVAHYADGKLRCYSDGNIAYQTESTKFVSRGVAIEKGKTGELGKELLIEAGAAAPLWLINPYSCKSYGSLGFTSRDEIVRPDPLMHILRLREDHGYLDLYTKGQQVIEKGLNGRVTIRQVTRLPFVPENKYHIKYYRTGKAEAIELNSVRGGDFRASVLQIRQCLCAGSVDPRSEVGGIIAAESIPRWPSICAFAFTSGRAYDADLS
ncbi:MAG: hypothetical protein PHY62_04960 [Gallionella sp.]|nr:hypothetical protein [Gallionella sp.]